MSRIDRVIRRNKRRREVITIAKIIAGNYDDWKAYLGKAEKVIEYIKNNKEKDLFI